VGGHWAWLLELVGGLLPRGWLAQAGSDRSPELGKQASPNSSSLMALKTRGGALDRTLASDGRRRSLAIKVGEQGMVSEQQSIFSTSAGAWLVLRLIGQITVRI